MQGVRGLCQWITFYIYKKRARTRLDFPNMLELLVMIFCEVAPNWYFRRHGLNGIIRTSQYMLNLGRIILYPIRIVLVFVLRIMKEVLRLILTVRRYCQTVIPSYRCSHLLTSESLQLNHGIWFLGFVYSADTLETHFTTQFPLRADFMIFVHLYPLNQNERTNNSEHRISLDHWPELRTNQWRVGGEVTIYTPISTLDSGYYNVKIGLYNPVTFERVNVFGSQENDISLGWIRVGARAK